ncbi:hypothetical protein SKPI104516_12635 [Skermania piniformis]
MTVTVPEDIAATLEQWRDSGRIKSVSQYITSQILAGMNRAAALRTVESACGGADEPKRPPLDEINRARRLLELPPFTEAEAEAISAEAWATPTAARTGVA